MAPAVSQRAILEALPLAALRLKYRAELQALERVGTERLSLSDFTRQAWHVIEPSTEYVSGWHLDCIAAHLEAVTLGQIRQLIINIPPRHSKSLTVSVFWPMWVWTTQPATRWLFNSYAESLSVRDNLKCRRLILSPWYQQRWGHVFRLSGDQNQKTRFENDRTGYRIASSVGGSNTGEGGDYMVADDPHNILETESEVIREGVLTWWDEVMSTRLNDPATGRRVIIMQRCHEDDLTGHLLERGGYHHLCLPARYEPRVVVPGVRVEHAEAEPHDECPIYRDPRRDAGTLLWPDRFDDTALAGLERDLGPYAASGQLQQRPVPREGQLFKSDWFKPLPSDFDEKRDDGRTMRQRLNIVQAWDLAYSEKTTADYTSAVTVGIDTKQNIYILDAWRERIDEHALDGAMAKHIGATSPYVVGIEEGAFKQAATRDLVRRLSRLVARPVAFLAIKATTDKVFRAQLPAGRAQGGFIYADREAAWWPALETELLKFPKGHHDDQVDALSLACQLALEKAAYRPPIKTEYQMTGRDAKPPDWDPFEELNG